MSVKKKTSGTCDELDVFTNIEKNGRKRQYIMRNGKRVWLHVYLVEEYIKPPDRNEVVHTKKGLKNDLLRERRKRSPVECMVFASAPRK